MYHITPPTHRFLIGLFAAALVFASTVVVPPHVADAALIAGTDFSDTPVFNAPGGQANLDNANTDDLDLSDDITVTNWAFANGGKFEGWDNSAQGGMANSPVTKIDGEQNNANTAPPVGGPPPANEEAFFSINIPDTKLVDLTSVTWDWRKATGGTNQRWLAFRTGLDANLVFSQLGPSRNAVVNQTVTLNDPKYKNLTDQTVTFHWYAGGEGSGDIDIDTIIVNGDVSPIPEPSSLFLAAIGLLGLLGLGRRRRR